MWELLDLIPSEARLPLFWSVAVALAFNVGYVLHIIERGSSAAGRGRTYLTVVIGTLVMLGTYAAALSEKNFVLRDCTLLALVAAHGWTGEEFVQSFIDQAKRR